MLLTLHNYSEACANEYIIKNNSHSWIVPARWEETKDNREMGLVMQTFCPGWGKGLGRCLEGVNLHGDSCKISLLFWKDISTLHTPWGPFRFPEGPRRETELWTRKSWRCFTAFWRWAVCRSICREAWQRCSRTTIPVLTTYLSQEPPVRFKTSRLNTSCCRFGFRSIFTLGYWPNRGFWISVFTEQRGIEWRGERNVLKRLILLHANVCASYFLKQGSVSEDINHWHYLQNLSSLTHQFL